MNKVILIAFIAVCVASSVQAFIVNDAPATVQAPSSQDLEEVSDKMNVINELMTKSEFGRQELSSEEKKNLNKARAFIVNDAPATVQAPSTQDLEEVSDKMNVINELLTKSEFGRQELSAEEKKNFNKARYVVDNFILRNAPGAPDDIDGETLVTLQEAVMQAELIDFILVLREITEGGTKELSEKDMETVYAAIKFYNDVNESIANGTYIQFMNNLVNNSVEIV